MNLFKLFDVVIIMWWFWYGEGKMWLVKFSIYKYVENV